MRKSKNCFFKKLVLFLRVLEMKIILFFLINFNFFNPIEKQQLRNPNKTITHVYYSRLFLDSKISRKSYCSILKVLKVLCFLPLFQNGKFIMEFFTRQCSLVNNNSELFPIRTKKMFQSLSTVEFSTNDIVKIIKNLSPRKPHGHDVISIQMLKNCDESIWKPLGIIFRSCVQNGKFS